MRKLIVALTLASACLAFAQSVPAPHRLFAGGVFLGRLTGISGGERYVIADGTVKENVRYRPMELSYIPVPDEDLNAWMKKMLGAPKIGEATIVSPRDPQSGLPTGRRVNLHDIRMTSFTVPAINPRSDDDPDPVRVEAQFNPKEVGVDKSVAGRPGRAKWGNITFRLSMDGKEVPVVRTEKCTVRVQTGDLDGDGSPDVYLDVPNFSFVVRNYDSDPYVEDVVRAERGEPVERLLSYTVFNDGQEVVTVESVVGVISVEDVTMFPLDGSPGRARVIVRGWDPTKKHRYVGTVTIVK